MEDLLYALLMKSSVGAVAHKVLQERTRVHGFAGERYRDRCVVGLPSDGAERTKKIRAPNRRTNIALDVRINRCRCFLQEFGVDLKIGNAHIREGFLEEFSGQIVNRRRPSVERIDGHFNRSAGGVGKVSLQNRRNILRAARKSGLCKAALI